MATNRTPATTTRARRVPGKATAAAGAAQTANTANLQAQGTATTTAPAPAPAPQAAVVAPQTNDANLVMPHVRHDVLVAEMKAVTAGFKAAINLEIAVACAVFIDFGGSGLAAKKELYAVYADAGYDCKVGGEGKDYKTVNRRIGIAAQFFDSLEKDSLKAVMGDARDVAAIQSLVTHIGTKYNFRTMSDVQDAAGIVRTPRQSGTGGGDQGGSGNAGGSGGAPAGDSGGGARAQASQPDDGDRAVMQSLAQTGEARVEASRREFDDQSKWIKLTFDGATLIVPKDMKTESLADLGIKLMTAAKEMHGAATVIGAVLNETFKEAVANH